IGDLAPGRPVFSSKLLAESLLTHGVHTCTGGTTVTPLPPNCDPNAGPVDPSCPPVAPAPTPPSFVASASLSLCGLHNFTDFTVNPGVTVTVSNTAIATNTTKGWGDDSVHL